MEALNTVLMLYGSKVGFVVEIVIVIAMILVILVQRTSSDGLSGLGGGGGLSGHSILSSSTSKNILTRTTAILATLFILNSLILAKLTALAAHAPSIVEQYQTKAPAAVTRSVDKQTVPGALNQEKNTTQQKPADTVPVTPNAAPQAPAAPQSSVPIAE